MRGSNVQARQADLAKSEAALEQERREIAELDASLQTALDRRPGLADDAAGFTGNEVVIGDLQAELLRRREYVLPRRQADAEEARSQLAHAEWGDAEKRLVTAQKRRREVSAKVAAKLDELLALTHDLNETRLRVEEAEAEFIARAPSDADDYVFPEDARDEPEWPERGTLLEVVKAGPRQPLAEGAKSLERLERQQLDPRKEAIASAVDDVFRDGSFERARSLSAEQLASAVVMLERRVEVEVARRSKANDDAWRLAEGGEQTARVVQALRNRVERLRKLAGQVEAAA